LLPVNLEVKYISDSLHVGFPTDIYHPKRLTNSFADRGMGGGGRGAQDLHKTYARNRASLMVKDPYQLFMCIVVHV
jgi:hypothetical protein